MVIGNYFQNVQKKNIAFFNKILPIGNVFHLSVGEIYFISRWRIMVQQEALRWSSLPKWATFVTRFLIRQIS